MAWFEEFALRSLLLPESRLICERAVMRRPVPDLFHYTSEAGLIGIMGSRTLWLTECRSLNDTSEFTYAEQIIRETLEGKIHDVAPELREWLRAAAGIARQIGEVAPYYIASFSEKGDSLSQWRAYASQGYCIRFYGRAMEKARNVLVLKVIYDPVQQREIILETLEAHLKAFAQVVHRDGGNLSELNDISANFGAQIGLYVVCFKHPAFEDEREWRVTTGAAHAAVRIRETNGFVQPYVVLSLKESWRSPIVKVCHAPARDAAEARRHLEALLEQHGYARDLAESSPIPLRL